MTYNIVIHSNTKHTHYIYTHIYVYVSNLSVYNSSWFKSIMKFQHPGISFLVHLQNLFSHLQVFQGYLKQRMRISNFEMVKYYIHTWPTVNIHNTFEMAIHTINIPAAITILLLSFHISKL